MVPNQANIVAAVGSHPETLWTQNRTGRLLAWSHKDRRGGSPPRVTNSRAGGAPSSEPGASPTPPSVKALAPSPFTTRQPGAARDRRAPLSFFSPNPKARAIVAPPALTRGDGRDVGGASSSASESDAVASRAHECGAAPARGWGRTFCEGRR